MSREHVMTGMPGAHYRGLEEEDGGKPARTFGPVTMILLGLIVAVDASLLAAPLYYGTISPCQMVALSRAHLHSRAVDDDITLSDEIAADVFQASSYWVRTTQSIPSCAGHVGGKTLSALIP